MPGWPARRRRNAAGMACVLLQVQVSAHFCERRVFIRQRGIYLTHLLDCLIGDYFQALGAL